VITINKIKLAVIGTGMAWERLHWPAIQQMLDKYEVVALCNKTKSDAETFARQNNLNSVTIYDDYNEMLERTDIDAVDVMVPISENFEVATAVIKAGKNLIAEKPMAATLEGAKQLVDLSKQYNVKIMIAENYRYNEENNKIRDIIRQGKIGEVVYFIQNNAADFKSQMTKDTFAAKEWRQHPNFKGGAFLDAALHDVARMRYIFGDVDHVYAMGRPQQEDFNPYMSVNTQILFKNGVIGQYVYYPHGKETQKPLIGLRIFGTNGEVYLEDKKSGTIYITYYDGNTESVPYTPERGYYNELLNFYNAMMGLEDIKCTPEIEYSDVKMVFDILKSIETKQPVKVDTEDTEQDTEYKFYTNLYETQNDRPYLH